MLLAQAVMRSLSSAPPRGLFAHDLLVIADYDGLRVDFRSSFRRRYLAAPERLGLISEPVGLPSLLFESGILLYIALAGRRPWSFARGEAWHLTSPHPLPHTISRPFRAMVMRLLRVDPRERYNTVEAVLHDLGNLARGKRDFAIGRVDQRTSLALPDLVGRTLELQRIARLFESEPVLLIEGASGLGKSRLLSEAADRGRSLGWRISTFRGEPVDEGELRGCLEFLNGLAPLAGDAIASALDRVHPAEESRTCDHLEALLEEALTRIASAEARPWLLLIDDAEWVPPVFLRAAFHAARREKMALFATARPGTLEGQVHSLSPLSAKGLRTVLSSMAGRFPGPVLTRLLGMAQGNPFIAVEGLRGLVRGELWNLHREGGLTESSTGDSTPVETLAIWTIEELNRLSPEEQRILILTSVCGRMVHVEVGSDGSASNSGQPGATMFVAQLAGEPVEMVQATFDQAYCLGLLYRREEDGRLAFFHHEVVAVLRDRAPDSEMRRAHLELAYWCEKHRPDPVRLARHFSLAGRHDMARPYAVHSGRRAIRLDNLALAEEMFRLAVTDRRAPGLCRELADILIDSGRSREEAFRLLEQAWSQSEGADRARVASSMARLEYSRGRPEESLRYLRAALAELKRDTPIQKLTLPHLALEFARQFVHRGSQRGRTTIADFDLEELGLCRRLYRNLIEVSLEMGNTGMAGWAQLRLLNELERFSPTPDLGVIYCYYLAIDGGRLRRLAIPGNHWREGFVALARRGTPWQKGKARVWLTFHHFLSGRLLRSEALARKNMENLALLGDQRGFCLVATQLSNALCALGRKGEAVEVARRAYTGSLRWGSRLGTARALRAWAEAGDGRIPRELIEREFSRPGASPYRHFELVQAEAFVLAGQERFEEAALKLKQFLSYNKLLGCFVELVLPWIAQWQRLACERDGGKELLVLSKRSAEAAGKRVRECTPGFSHAQREWALYALRRGDIKAAARRLKQSIKAASELRQAHEEEQSRSVYARLAGLFGWPALPGEQVIRLVEAHANEATSFQARLADFLETAPALLESPSRHETIERAAEALRQTLRAESVWVLRFRGNLWQSYGDEGPRPQEEIEACSELGHPMVVENPSLVPELAVFGVKSAMLVPVGPKTVFLLAHRRFKRAFLEEDIGLGDFLSTLVETALRGQRMFRELRDGKLRFRTLFENAAVGLQLIDCEGKLLSENGYLRGLLALGNQDQWDPLARLEPEDRQREVVLMSDLLEGRRESYSCLSKHRRWDGSSAWTQVNVTLVRDAQGNPSCVVRAVGDVSSKHLESVIDFGEQQRQMLAMDLHDGLAQTLLSAIQKTYLEPSLEVQSMIRAQLSASVDEIRLLHRELTSPKIARRTYQLGLRDCLLNFSSDSGIELNWSVKRRKSVRWPQGLPGLFAYRIVSEALSNVLRHSGARNASVLLRVGRRRIRGEVFDDGDGLSRESTRAQLGLKGIHLRCELLGGRCEVASRAGEGTRVRFILPIEEFP